MGRLSIDPFSPSPQHGLHPRGSQPFREAVTAYFKDAYREAGGRVDVGFSEGAIEVNGGGALYRQRPQGGRRGAV
jgi:hypothetical protein